MLSDRIGETGRPEKADIDGHTEIDHQGLVWHFDILKSPTIVPTGILPDSRRKRPSRLAIKGRRDTPSKLAAKASFPGPKSSDALPCGRNHSGKRIVFAI